MLCTKKNKDYITKHKELQQKNICFYYNLKNKKQSEKMSLN